MATQGALFDEDVTHLILSQCDGKTLKSTRLVSATFNNIATRYLFEVVYVSYHITDLIRLKRITDRPKLRHAARELVYDSGPVYLKHAMNETKLLCGLRMELGLSKPTLSTKYDAIEPEKSVRDRIFLEVLLYAIPKFPGLHSVLMIACETRNVHHLSKCFGLLPRGRASQLTRLSQGFDYDFSMQEPLQAHGFRDVMLALSALEAENTVRCIRVVGRRSEYALNMARCDADKCAPKRLIVIGPAFYILDPIPRTLLPFALSRLVEFCFEISACRFPITQLHDGAESGPEGTVAAALSYMKQLQTLEMAIVFDEREKTSVDLEYSDYTMISPNVLMGETRLPKLKNLRLRGFWTAAEELCSLLTLHQDTLETVSLEDMNIVANVGGILGQAWAPAQGPVVAESWNPVAGTLAQMPRMRDVSFAGPCAGSHSHSISADDIDRFWEVADAERGFPSRPPTVRETIASWGL